MPRQASSSVSSPLYGRSRPKNSTTGPSTRAQLVGQRQLVGASAGQVLERAVVDHVHLRRVERRAVDELPAAVLGVDDDRVDASYSRRWARAWPGRGSRGSRSWAVSTTGGAGSSARVEPLHVEPLEVHDVGGARATRR